ncbi:MAG TPA: hypothetical protein VMC06_15745 [Opitutaceae bacterium]|nr:hypothetical protein [Opitutaceae bacterium]
MISRGFRLLLGLGLLPAAVPSDLPAAGAPVGHAAPASPILDDARRALLEDALARIAADSERWAYTETSLANVTKGKNQGEKVVRYDPSRPYDEQYTLLKIDGQPPTAEQIAHYRQTQEKRRRERAERERKGLPGHALGDLVDLTHATVVTEDAAKITFEVPLRAQGNRRFPPEKFRVLARLDKEHRALENVAVRLREPWRTAVVVKIKSGELNADFTTVDPKYAPLLTGVQADGAGSILFIPIGGSFDLRRTEIQRVKPYRERLDVKIGPLKVLDF